MKKIVFFVLLIGCNYNNSLQRVCPTTCYTSSKSTENVGICHSGKPVCDENFNVLRCDGEVTPDIEVCDGLDNNCDGRIDEGMEDFWYYSFTEMNKTSPCQFKGECADVRIACEDGTWACHYSDTVELNSDGTVVTNETRCDDRDGNCDGLKDNINYTGQYCYDGPNGTDVNPPCHPGTLDCQDGEVVCKNEVVPNANICDPAMNCGYINTGGALSDNYDMLFNLDTSGSMGDKINAVAIGISQYSSQFEGNDHYRWGISLFTGAEPNKVYKLLDFTDFATFKNALNLEIANGDGDEASLDGMLETCEKTANPLGFSWRSGANGVVFTFTDEHEQTYTIPPTTEQDVINACINDNVLPIVFAATTDFQNITSAANGLYFNLVPDWQTIFNDLNSVIVVLCGS